METKSLENLDMLIRDLKECRTSIEMLMIKLSHDNNYEQRADWPAILNSLRIISTNLISTTKFIKDKKEMMFKSIILLPKFFSEDIDIDLKESTNNRISVFNQDVIPHILRTKLIPVLEENERVYNVAAKDFEQMKAYDLTEKKHLYLSLYLKFKKNISQLKKTIDDSANMIEKPKRELDLAKTSLSTYSYQDTWQLVNLYVNLSQGNRQNIGSRQPHFQRMPLQQ